MLAHRLQRAGALTNPHERAFRYDGADGEEEPMLDDLLTMGSRAVRERAAALEALRHDGLFWRKLAYAGAAYGPWWWRRYTPPAFGSAFWALLSKQRRAVANNWRVMGLAHDELEANAGALRTFIEFALSLTDGHESIAKGLDGYILDSPSDERFSGPVRSGRGCILLTAHTGSWEVVGRLIGRNHGAPLTMVMTREQNASTRSFADALRTRKNEGDFEIAYVGSDPLAALPLVNALRRGRVVALQFDRVPPGMASISVPFFGRMQPFPAGPFRLAQLAGCELIMAFTHRTDFRRYAVEIPPIIRVPKGKDDELIRVAVASAARELEAFVRRHPTHWFHFEPLASELAP